MSIKGSLSWKALLIFQIMKANINTKNVKVLLEASGCFMVFGRSLQREPF